MDYRIELRPAAFRELAKLEAAVKERIAAKIESLSKTPRPRGVEKLQGQKNRYRVRTGDYRIIYEVHDDILLILVVRIGHRQDVYKKVGR
ncbi:MAG: type II toxin-antitoxin system RelE/ParE family toxin [Proteobacteria bacterium]|nr:type II toxin-antitoxin system RelE/ParE family toxin [Pseudomonadota bacterium]MBU1740786.1 type II toxin-antitoxin system RelE/ParE family toxin [Pseudomonadota bacterium]